MSEISDNYQGWGISCGLAMPGQPACTSVYMRHKTKFITALYIVFVIKQAVHDNSHTNDDQVSLAMKRLD